MPIEVQNHLEQLSREDATRADDYKLRLARAQSEGVPQNGGRADRVRQLLGEVDVSRVSDPSLLRGADKLFFAHGFAEKAVAGLERLTVLEPAERSHWERWVSALAGGADEESLRNALRRLLAGVTQPPLGTETLDLLRSHVVDSCWRSIAALIATGDRDRLSEIPPLIETIERTKKPGAEQLWITWTRGWVARQLGHGTAAIEAAGQLEVIAAALPRAGDGSGEPAPLLFPDGLSTSLERATALLREEATVRARMAGDAGGP